MEIRSFLGLRILLISLVLICGCKLGEGNISDRIPSGRLIPLDQAVA